MRPSPRCCFQLGALANAAAGTGPSSVQTRLFPRAPLPRSPSPCFPFSLLPPPSFFSISLKFVLLPWGADRRGWWDFPAHGTPLLMLLNRLSGPTLFPLLPSPTCFSPSRVGSLLACALGHVHKLVNRGMGLRAPESRSRPWCWPTASLLFYIFHSALGWRFSPAVCCF